MRPPPGLDTFSQKAKLSAHILQAIKSLIAEANLVEHYVAALITHSRPQTLGNVEQFDSWIANMQSALEHPSASKSLQLTDANKNAIHPASRVVRLWGKQPWSPRHLDWEIQWQPTDSQTDFSSHWHFDGNDYHPTAGSNPQSQYSATGRSLMSPLHETWFEDALERLGTVLDSDAPHWKLFHANASTWYQKLQTLQHDGVLVQPLTGFHHRLIARNSDRPRVGPGPMVNSWTGATGDDSWEHAMLQPTGLKTVQDITQLQTGVHTAWVNPASPDQPRATQAPNLPPPGVANGLPFGLIRSGYLPFGLIRSGYVTIKRLWMVDDFGQWADLLHKTATLGALGIVPSPRLQISPPQHEPEGGKLGSGGVQELASISPAAAALRPRILQPGRLHFSLLSADDPTVETADHPGTNPICGWVV